MKSRRFSAKGDRASAESNPSSEGRLIALLVAGFYGLFTLAPDSSTLGMTWPWVFIGQVALLCPMLWWLAILWSQQKIQGLGRGLDWITLLVILGLVVSSGFAEFPQQARWYSWGTLGFLAALYGLNSWLSTPGRRYALMMGQGWLSLAFIIASLCLWTTQTLLPELKRLEGLRPYGVDLPFNFAVLELRNWAPIGHQNYVAGYLLLALPLFVGLSILQTGWRRWLWIGGMALGLLDLYTTSSRGGWLSLLALLLIIWSLLLWRQPFPHFSRLWLALAGLGGWVLLIGGLMTNNRFQAFIAQFLAGQSSGESTYRQITASVGWGMGRTHPATGVGLGGVPLLYQHYHPVWAGREAELTHQLHNTPVQLWAELGVWGILALVAGSLWFLYWGWQWLVNPSAQAIPKTDQVLFWSVFAGLFAYGLNSWSDFQLNVICISGLLTIFLAVLASSVRAYLPDLSNKAIPRTVPAKPPSLDRPSAIAAQISHPRVVRGVTLTMAGLIIVVSLWMIPIHRGWQLSSLGFTALNRSTRDPEQQVALVKLFEQRLTQAAELVPWEPYYPLQLGWNLGNLSLQTPDLQRRQTLTDASIAWLQQGTQVAPFQEFGYTNLGWLLSNRDPQRATQQFIRAAQLLPAKRSIFFGLGFSLLAQGKTDLAIQAFKLEALRDPLMITSPIWKPLELQPIFQQVLQQMQITYSQLLKQPSQPPGFITYLHQCRGGVSWWQGKRDAARRDWQPHGTQLSRWILQLAAQKSPPSWKLSTSASDLTLAAWVDPKHRPALLQRAWVTATQTVPPPEFLQELVTSMAKSNSIDQWLQLNAPVQQYRRARLGFDVVSGHGDGPNPVDLLTVVENAVMTTLMPELLPSPIFAPELDLALQPERDQLLKQITQ
ncbi:O-antigen ligase family protein [Neosynechococcus sphagnicola]|uniref:O-antigen ligase family protein n=1 Tax=Neosynechococcus sphagnicola TaxID=1501145 RepID=UPI00068F7E33|nr:O-antigen ligase family protein [Neosynechococcus sphagnicola]